MAFTQVCRPPGRQPPRKESRVARRETMLERHYVITLGMGIY